MKPLLYQSAKDHPHLISNNLIGLFIVLIYVLTNSAYGAKSLIITNPGKGNMIVNINTSSIRVINWKNIYQGLGVYKISNGVKTTIRDENTSDLLSTWSSFTFDVANSNVGDEYYIEAFGARYSTNTNPDLWKKIVDTNFEKIIVECLKGLIPVIGGEVGTIAMDMYRNYELYTALYDSRDDKAKIVDALIKFGKDVVKKPELLQSIFISHGYYDFTIERAKSLAGGINLAFVGLQLLDWFWLSSPFDVTVIKCVSDYAVEITPPASGNYQYGLPIVVNTIDEHDLAFNVKNIGSMSLQNAWVILKIINPKGDSVEVTKTESGMLGINLIAYDLNNKSYQQGSDIPSQALFQYKASPSYKFSNSIINNHIYRGGSYQYKIEVWRNGKPYQPGSQLVASQIFPLFIKDYVPSTPPIDVRVSVGGTQQKPNVSVAWEEPTKDVQSKEEWDLMEYKVYRSDQFGGYSDIGHVFVAGPTGVLTQVYFNQGNHTTILSDSKANFDLDYSHLPIQPNINHFIDVFPIMSNTRNSVTVYGDITQSANSGDVYAIHSYMAQTGIDRHNSIIFQDTTVAINKTYYYKVAVRDYSYIESDKSAEVKIVLKSPTINIIPDKQAYTLGIDAQAVISMSVTDAGSNPLSGATINATIQDPNGSKSEFSTTGQTIYDNGNGKYLYNYSLQGKPLGTYSITVTGFKNGLLDFVNSSSFRLQNQSVGHNLKLELSVDPGSLSTRPSYAINGSFKINNIGIYSENCTMTIKLLDNNGNLIAQEKSFTYTNISPSNSVASDFQIIPSGTYQNYQGEAKVEGEIVVPLDEDWTNNYNSIAIYFGNQPLYKYYKGHPYQSYAGQSAITEGDYSFKLNYNANDDKHWLITVKRISDGSTIENNQNIFEMQKCYFLDGGKLLLYFDYVHNWILDLVLATNSTESQIKLTPDRLIATEGKSGYFVEYINDPDHVQSAKILFDGNDGNTVNQWSPVVVPFPSHDSSKFVINPPIGSVGQYKVWLGSNFLFSGTNPAYRAFVAYAEIIVLPAPKAGVQIDCSPLSKTINPGETVTFELSVKNSGEIQDTINLSTTLLPDGWYLALPTNNIFLNPGTDQKVTISLSHRRGVDITTPVSITVTAISQRDPTKQSQIQLTVHLKDTIPPSVKLLSPTGSVNWKYGSQNIIRWEASDNDSVTSISLFLSLDGGKTFLDTIGNRLSNAGSYIWTVLNKPSNFCRLKILANDRSGNEGAMISDNDFTITNILREDRPDKLIPKQYNLSYNYPNPFNPLTTIEFSLPRASFVTLRIYNLLGQEVALLVNEILQPGTYKAQWNACGFASGIYICFLTADNFLATKKLLLLK